MQFLKLVLRNSLRHKLRTGLTVLGLVVAILAFGLLQTVVDAWYAGAESAAPNRIGGKLTIRQRSGLRNHDCGDHSRAPVLWNTGSEVR